MANEHDSGYKFLFSTPELVRDLILGFVPDEWLHSLDYARWRSSPEGSKGAKEFGVRSWLWLGNVVNSSGRRARPGSR